MLRRMFMIAALGVLPTLAQGEIIYNPITTEFVKTSVQTIDSVEYHIWEMRATAPGDWTNSRLEVTLSSGLMYNDPAGGTTEPDPALFGTHPNLQWDTYVTVPGGFGADVALGGEIIMEDTTVGVSWGDLAIDEGGTWKVAQMTLSSDALGWVEGVSNTPGGGFASPFSYSIEDGQIVPEPMVLLFLGPVFLFRRMATGHRPMALELCVLNEGS